MKKTEKFLADIFRVCKKHGMIIAHEDRGKPMSIEKMTTQNVNHLKYAVDKISESEGDDKKNSKVKYKFHKPDDVKKENVNPKQKFKFYKPEGEKETNL
jgi:predicted peptidase